MELTLNIGDNITIPANSEVVVNNNILTIKEMDFKDGDILHSKYNTSQIVIFSNHIEKDKGKGLFNSYLNSDIYFNSVDDSNNVHNTANFRHATEEEKQAFFDDLKAKGLRWNAETKEMERIRVRVKYGDLYLNVSTSCEVIEARECCDSVDNKRWEVGNYYLLSEREQAEEDVKALKAIFKKRLKI